MRTKTKSVARTLRAAGEAGGDSKIIKAVGSVTLQAGAAGDPGKGGAVRIAITGYTGGQMRVQGFNRPTVIDLQGLRFDDRIAVLGDHAGDLENMLGEGEVSVKAGRIDVAATIVTGTPRADRVVQLLKAGVKVAASVGVRVERIETVRAGAKVTVNGQVHTAGDRGLDIVRAGQLYEVSLLPIGADGMAGARLAATGANGEGEGAGDAGGDADIELAERRRIEAITVRCGAHTDLAARAISEGWTLNQAELELLRAGRPRVHPLPNRRPGVAPGLVLQAALFSLVGRGGDGEKVLGAAAMEAGDALRCSSMADLAAAALRMDHRDVPTGRDQALQAAFSTTSLPIYLGAGIDKMIGAQLASAPATWSKIARRVPVPNFREQTLVRLVMRGGLEEVGASGELKHAALEEASQRVRVETFGRILSLTRQAIINDDLSLFDSLPNALAMEWSRLLQDLVWGVLIAADETFFSEENGNLLEGTDTVLSVPSLSLALKALRSQRDEDGRILDMAPAVLAVPPALEATGRALLISAQIGYDDGTPTANPHQGLAELVVEPRLGADAGGSDTAWYLAAAPSNGAVNLALLNGIATPKVETNEVAFDKLGVAWRCYGDAGAALGEHRAIVKATGVVAEGE